MNLEKSYLYKIIVNKEKLFAYKYVLYILWIFSFIYGFSIKLRILFYKFKIFRKYYFDKPVISIGNIIVGGSGKTAFAQILHKFLKNRFKISSAILLRGYGAKIQITDYRLQVTENTVKKNMVDEEAMLRQNLKNATILVGKNRVANAEFAFKKLNFDCVILDDGYQYLRLHKSLNIVLLKATSILEEEFLLPRGLLREPYSHLDRADILILTDTDRVLTEDLNTIKNFIKSFVFSIDILSAVYQFEAVWDLVTEKECKYYDKDEKYLAISGIGDPESFLHSLSKQNFKLGGCITYPDHHSYCLEDIKYILQVAKSKDIYSIITTQKDAYKLKPYIDLFIKANLKNIFVLNVELQLEKNSEAILYDKLCNILNI